MVKIQYAIVVFSASVELFMCALPADNLMHTVSLNLFLINYNFRYGLPFPERL